MPAKASRNQRKQQQRKPQLSLQMAAPNVWSTGSKVELKSNFSTTYNQQLYHNSPAFLNNVVNQFNNITIGTGLQYRIGHRITVRGLELCLVLNNKVTRPNVTYRVIICATPASNSTDTFAELFGVGNFTSLVIPQTCQVIADRVICANQGGTQVTPGYERSSTCRIRARLNHNVSYDISTVECLTRLCIFVAAFDAWGTLLTDNIASVAQGSLRIDFTDE